MLSLLLSIVEPSQVEGSSSAILDCGYISAENFIKAKFTPGERVLVTARRPDGASSPCFQLISLYPSTKASKSQLLVPNKLMNIFLPETASSESELRVPLNVDLESIEVKGVAKSICLRYVEDACKCSLNEESMNFFRFYVERYFEHLDATFEGSQIIMSYMGEHVTARVIAIEPSDGGHMSGPPPHDSPPTYYSSNKSTRVYWHTDPNIPPLLSLPKLCKSLKSVFYAVDDQIDWLMNFFGNIEENSFSRQGLLVCGPKSSAKRSILKHALYARQHIFFVNWFKARDLLEMDIRQFFLVFEKLISAPKFRSLVVIENVDLILSNSDLRYGNVFRHVFHRMFIEKKRLLQIKEEYRGLVAIIGISDSIENIEALDLVAEFGLFEHSIEFDLPNFDQRKLILTNFFSFYESSTDCARRLRLTDKMVSQTHGFSSGNLFDLVRKFTLMLSSSSVANELLSMNGRTKDGSLSDSLPVEHLLSNLSLSESVDSADSSSNSCEKRALPSPSHIERLFLECAKSICLSDRSEWQVTAPQVHWSDIGGQEFAKSQLIECIEWPLKYPDIFRMLNMAPPKGVLLYGPPGNSKTLLAKAVATESRMNFMAVKGPQLLNKWVGESEKALKEVFRLARKNGPTILFFDEIDSIAGRRGSSGGNDGGASQGAGDRLLTQLLIELDGITSVKQSAVDDVITDQRIIFIAATNRPDILDPALLRPGRLDRHIYIRMPDYDARVSILRLTGRQMNSFHKDVDLLQLALLTDGYSGAELVQVCQHAAMLAMIENPEAAELVYQHHLLESVKTLQPRTKKELIEYFDNYSKASRINAS